MLTTRFTLNDHGHYDVAVNRKNSSEMIDIGCLVHLNPTTCDFVPSGGDPTFQIIDQVILKAYQMGYLSMHFRVRRGTPTHPSIPLNRSDVTHNYYLINNLCNYCIDNSLI